MSYSCEKSISRKKTDTFRWENFHLLYYLGMRWCYNILRCVLLSNFRSIICQVDVHWRFKTTENFKLLALKWSRSFTRGGRLQEVQNIVIWLLVFWKTGRWGETVAYERLSQSEVRLYTTCYYVTLGLQANQQQTTTRKICELKS